MSARDKALNFGLVSLGQGQDREVGEIRPGFLRVLLKDANHFVALKVAFDRVTYVACVHASTFQSGSSNFCTSMR